MLCQNINDTHLNTVRGLEKEIIDCRKTLDGVLGTNVCTIRSELRKAEYNKCKALPQ